MKGWRADSGPESRSLRGLQGVWLRLSVVGVGGLAAALKPHVAPRCCAFFGSTAPATQNTTGRAGGSQPPIQLAQHVAAFDSHAPCRITTTSKPVQTRPQPTTDLPYLIIITPYFPLIMTGSSSSGRQPCAGSWRSSGPPSRRRTSARSSSRTPASTCCRFGPVRLSGIDMNWSLIGCICPRRTTGCGTAGRTGAATR